jgi:hypothetical protein
MTASRPFPVTILAVLAGLAAIVAIIHTLQYLHLLPFFLGPVAFFTFDLGGALLWGLLALIYLWLTTRLWAVDRQAWLFLTTLAALNLILAGVSILGNSSFQAMLPSILINGAVLLYCLIPSTKAAFDVA